MGSEASHIFSLTLRYEGTDTGFVVPLLPTEAGCLSALEDAYRRNFGFVYKDRKVWVDNVRLKTKRGGSTGRGSLRSQEWKQRHSFPEVETEPETTTGAWFEGPSGEVLELATPVHRVEQCKARKLSGPGILLVGTSTVVVEPRVTAYVSEEGSIVMELEGEWEPRAHAAPLVANPIDLSITANRFMSVAEQMGR